MTSVSELKRAAMEEWAGQTASISEEPDSAAGEAAELFPPEILFPTIPFFAEEASGEGEEPKEMMKGTDYGTAVHRLLELFPYHRFPEPSACTKEELGVWIRELADSGRIPQEYVAGIRPGTLLSFLRSPLAARMAAADAAVCGDYGIIAGHRCVRTIKGTTCWS